MKRPITRIYLVAVFLGLIPSLSVWGQETVLPSPMMSNNSVISPSGAPLASGGPGTEMTKIINRLGLGSDCGRCQALAAQMDRNGSQWVRDHRQFVVQQTISNAENLGHRMGPVRRLGVRVIVNKALRRSR